MAKPEVNVEINASGNIQNVLVGLNRQFGGFFNTLKTGFQLNLGAKLANFMLGLPRQVAEIAQWAQGIKNAADQAQLSTGAFQVFARELQHSGVQVESLRTAISTLQRAQVDAVNKTGPMRDAFAQLGLDAQELSSIPLPLQLEKIAKAMASAEDRTSALSAASKLLGQENATKLLPLLNKLAQEGFGGLAQQAAAAGVILDDDVAGVFSRLNNQLNDLKTRFKVLSAEFLTIFEPVLQGVGKIAEFLMDVFSRVLVAVNRILRAIGALIEVATTDLTLEEANKILNEAAAADSQRLKGLGADGKPSVGAGNGGPGIERGPLRSLKDMTDEERSQFEYLTRTGETGAREVQFRLASIARDFSLTAEERRRATNEVLRARLDEIRALQSELDLIIEQLSLEDPRRGIFERTRDRLSDDATQTTQGLLDNNAQPLTAGEGVVAGWNASLDQLGTLATNVAQGITDTVGNAVNGITTALYDWVTGAESAGDAFRKLAVTMGQTVLQTLIQIGVQEAVLFAARKFRWVQESAQTKAQTSEKAAEGGMKSIAQLGPIWGPLAFAGAIAAIMALTSAFETGGLVRGGEQMIRVNEKGPEFVLNANAVRSIGLSNLEAMNDTGRIPSTALVGGASAGSVAPVSAGASRGASFAFFDSRREAERFARGGEWETQVIDLFHRRRSEFGIA